jgi:hypothetical protein
MQRVLNDLKKSWKRFFAVHQLFLPVHPSHSGVIVFNDGVPVLLRRHHIFECYPLDGYRASTMSHQTAPTPHNRKPSPSL